MFANPIWSVLILIGLFALYWFVIRPKAPILEVGKHIEGFWARWLVRLHRFRSFVATAIAGLLLALPDIVVAIAPIDLSGVIGVHWAQIITSLLAIYLAVNRAFSTKPGDEKP